MTRRDRTDGTDSPPEDRTDGSDPEHPPGDARSDADRGAAPSTDPRVISSLAVTKSDVVDALEADARGDREIVLRVTPPFSGRMRARLHDAGVVEPADDPERTGDRGTDGSDAGAPIHVPPERFVTDPPAYPTVDDTEDELRASETPYTRDRHRKRHEAAVEEWRQTVRDRLAASVTLETDAGPTTVSVSYLG